MPYKSQAQLRYMHAKHPDIADKWDKEYGVPEGLPAKAPKNSSPWLGMSAGVEKPKKPKKGK